VWVCSRSTGSRPARHSRSSRAGPAGAPPPEVGCRPASWPRRRAGRRDPQLLAGVRQTDRDRRAPATGDGPGSLEHGAEPTASRAWWTRRGPGPSRLRGAASSSGPRRAWRRARARAALVHDRVDGHDRGRPGDHGAEDGREPHPAEAEDRHRLPGADVGEWSARPHAGEQRAAEQRRGLRAAGRRDHHHRPAVDDHVFAKAETPRWWWTSARRGGPQRRPPRSSSPAVLAAAGVRTAPAGPGALGAASRSGGRTPARPGHPRRCRSPPAPTSRTCPAASWPRTIGVGRGRLPSTTDRSEWHSPAASTRTSSSPGPGRGELELATSRGRVSRRDAPGRGHQHRRSRPHRVAS
jgi:hypothetical protein